MVTLVNVPRYVALLKNYSSKPMLTKWIGKNGEQVEEGQPIVVIETSKAILEIEAIASGILFILREVGERVSIGDTLGMLANSEAEMEAFRTLVRAYPLECQPEQSTGAAG